MRSDGTELQIHTTGNPPRRSSHRLRCRHETIAPGRTPCHWQTRPTRRPLPRPSPHTLIDVWIHGVERDRCLADLAVAPVKKKGEACASARFGAKTTSEKRNAGVNLPDPIDRRDIALPSPLWIGFDGAMPSRRMMRSDRLFAMKSPQYFKFPGA